MFFGQFVRILVLVVFMEYACNADESKIIEPITDGVFVSSEYFGYFNG
ncbi:MAG: hypothetical protein JETT_3968 [Candidatus Jettenia ecosi]|uniref:Uncharacterized protein n=1 Tax=Candidatus Jettenia ecosi TaxID=2494326 RepID=A0A533Q5G8_9BACT|nr:MAG: hypothetical protein JETT_3968 [Candidatus Jettenia ecosi]